MTLQELLEQNGYRPRSYSGRNMYGQECLGVHVDNPVQAAQDIGALAAPYLITLPRVSFDSLGRGYILYWLKAGYIDNGLVEGEDADALLEAY